MSGEMVERVARAIKCVLEPIIAERVEPTPEEFSDMARAAIAAMREPSPAMCDVGFDAADPDEWRSMRWRI